jgi:hypothetical protein
MKVVTYEGRGVNSWVQVLSRLVTLTPSDILNSGCTRIFLSRHVKLHY